MSLDPRINESIVSLHASMLEKGELLPQDKLLQCYELFRERFGPQVLSGLDGEELLNLMHLHGNQESLVYWLEFKDDDEFPAKFGSIAGGSALKFGIYRNRQSGTWMTGVPKQQREVGLDEAIKFARRHRDQLVAGSQELAAMPEPANAADYQRLQQRLDEVAPDVSRLAWGHKYFSLLFPGKLVDYHSEEYQRFHLIKLLQTPPDQKTRYLIAEHFVALARDLGFSVNHLTSVLNARHGNP